MLKLGFIFALCGAVFALCADGAAYNGADIYNVQNYSSSPFYSSGGPYNQRFPAPAYVRGPDLTAAECMDAVMAALWRQCGFRGNCANAGIADVRPGVMLELSNRTDANYMSCSGYIDGIFYDYKRQATAAVTPTGFPTARAPAVYGAAAAEPQNPFSYETMAPYYEQQQNARENQLRAMQQQTGSQPRVTATKAPATFNDLGFSERMELMREGWQDGAVGRVASFQQLNIESDQTMEERIADRKRAEAQIENQKAAVAAEKEAAPYEAKKKIAEANAAIAKSKAAEAEAERKTAEETAAKIKAETDAFEATVAKIKAETAAKAAEEAAARTTAED